MSKNLDKRSRDNLVGIHSDLVALMEMSIIDCPIDFTIICGVRTTRQQQELYAQGRTKPGKIVTNCDGIRNKSNHQIKNDGHGYAVDAYPNKDGKVQVSDVAGLVVIAKHIKGVAKKLGVDIEWGGDWKMKDYPHFELKKQIK